MLFDVIRDGYKSRDYIRETRWYYRKPSGKLRPVVIFDSNGRVFEVRMEKIDTAYACYFSLLSALKSPA